MSDITKDDLNKAITETIRDYLKENRREILRRAKKKLKEQKKNA